MKKTFVFYNDRQDYTEEMSLEEKGLFLQVILDYQNGKELGDLGSIKFIRSRVKKQLDQDNMKRSEEIEKRKASGKLGGLAKSKSKQVLASASKGKHHLADNVNDNVNDKYNNIYIPPNKFIKPKIEEVKGYCLERKNNIDPQTFIDFYESNGRLIGKNKMKDRKACIRTRESRNKKDNKKPQYENKESRESFIFM